MVQPTVGYQAHIPKIRHSQNRVLLGDGLACCNYDFMCKLLISCCIISYSICKCLSAVWVAVSVMATCTESLLIQKYQQSSLLPLMLRRNTLQSCLRMDTQR